MFIARPNTSNFGDNPTNYTRLSSKGNVVYRRVNITSNIYLFFYFIHPLAHVRTAVVLASAAMFTLDA